MNSNLLEDFCYRILRAYRKYFQIKGGAAWVASETMFISFDQPQYTLLMGLTPSNPELGTRLSVNLSCAGNPPFLSVDSTGIKWSSPKPGLFTTEELQSLENLASRLYLIALDSADELRILTSSTG